MVVIPCRGHGWTVAGAVALGFKFGKHAAQEAAFYVIPGER